MQETIFYMGLQVSKQFELEKEFLTIDNYYDSIIKIAKLYYYRGYDKLNKGLLDSVNYFINGCLEEIKNILIEYNVSETKDWKEV